MRARSGKWEDERRTLEHELAGLREERDRLREARGMVERELSEARVNGAAVQAERDVAGPERDAAWRVAERMPNELSDGQKARNGVMKELQTGYEKFDRDDEGLGQYEGAY